MRGVPVLHDYYILKTLRDAVDYRDHMIAFLHRQAAAGQETVLQTSTTYGVLDALGLILSATAAQCACPTSA